MRNQSSEYERHEKQDTNSCGTDRTSLTNFKTALKKIIQFMDNTAREKPAGHAIGLDLWNPITQSGANIVSQRVTSN